MEQTLASLPNKPSTFFPEMAEAFTCRQTLTCDWGPSASPANLEVAQGTSLLDSGIPPRRALPGTLLKSSTKPVRASRFGCTMGEASF